MKIRRLAVRNYCQFSDWSADFALGVVGLVGPNGSGKSNLLQALYVALTGDFSRYKTTREGTLRAGCPADEPAYLQLWGEHGGRTFEVFRPLRDERPWLQLDGELYRGAQQVNSRLWDLLRIDRKVLDEMVFVSQWELLSILLDDPAERKKSLLAMCGLHHLERLHRDVRDYAVRRSTLATVLGDQQQRQLETLEQEVQQLQQDLQQEEQRVQELERQLLPTELQSVWERALEQFRQLSVLRETWRQLTDKSQSLAADCQGQTQTLAELEQELRVWEAERERWQLEQARLAAVCETLRQQRERLAAERQLQHQAYQAAVQRQQAAVLRRAELQRWLEDYPELSDPAEELAECRQDLQQWEREILPAVRLASELSARTEPPEHCPVCHQPWPREGCVTSVTEAVAEQRLQVLKERLCRLEEARHRFLDRQQARAAWRLEWEALELASVPPPEPPAKTVSEQELTAEEQAWEQARQAVQQSTAHLEAVRQQWQQAVERQARLSEEWQRCRGQLEQLTEQCQACEHVVRTVELTAEECQELLETQRRVWQEWTRVTARMELQRRTLAEKLQELERCRQAGPGLQRQRAWAERCELLAQQLHRDQLPTRALRWVLDFLRRRINALLDRFQVRFTVQITPDADFIAEFPGGWSLPARRLSGAEKVCLSLAIRLALYDLFHPRLGLLCLDEPAVGMDDLRLSCWQQVVRELSRRARQQGTQVLLVTHEEALRPVMDQVLSLGPA